MAKALMRKDLTGQRFGKLVALYVDEERTCGSKVYWICQCDCGKLTSVQSTSLTRKKGGTKSCGCARNSEEAVEKKENDKFLLFTGYNEFKIWKAGCSEKNKYEES